MEAARDRCRLEGLPKKIGKDKRNLAIDLSNSKKHSVAEIYETVGVSKPMRYKYINETK